MQTMQDWLFNQPDGLGWCDYNGGIQEKPAPQIKYIISLPNTKSNPYLGGDLQNAQYVKDIVNGEVITTSYHDSLNVKQFDSEAEAITWIEANGVKFTHSGLQVYID